ncbi:MAG TPA: hypothetical protein VGQ95_09970 [Chthoniobacterales bacterium]|nr:hypothetical protein [Chthoniobacterales bacterium]
MTASQITIDPERRMTTTEAEEHEQAIFKNIEDTGMRLLKLRDERGWEALSYLSFREYAQHLDDRMSLRKIYYLVDQAEVNQNLSRQLGKPVRLPMKHALALKDLEPVQQLHAFNEASKGYKKGDPKPTEKLFQKVAAKIAPAKTKLKKRPREASDGWSKEDLAKDGELSDHFLMIESVYGADDTKAIKNGSVPMQRADVLFLSRLPKENMLKIQDLIFTTRWSPKECIKFINDEPDDRSTVEELKFRCLTTKGKYWTNDFDGFAFTVKLTKAAKR